MQYEDTPATKSDVRVLTAKLDAVADRLERSIKSQERAAADLRETVQQGFRRVNQETDQVLTVLGSIDERLSGKVGSHKQRIERLERHLGLMT